MNSPRFTLVCVLLLGVLAGGLRFHRLGDWPFAGDELPTIFEADCLLGSGEAAPQSQSYRLPRLVPLSYGVHYVGYVLFGRDEFGSRALMAMLGTLGVIAVFLGLDRLAGRATALSTSILLCLWPEHLLQSQQNRFYITASLFASLTMLLGAWCLRRGSVPLAVAAALAAAAAVLSHSLLCVLFAGLLLALLAGSRVQGRPLPLREMAAVTLVGAVTAAGMIALFLTLGSGWNRSADWGYGVAHALKAAVNSVGLPVALLASVGAVDAIRQRDGLGVYWLSWALLWAVAAAALPFAVVYHPAYVFPLALGVFVLAGQATARIYASLKSCQPLTAAAWLAAAFLLGLPGVVSHYADGSRYDFRGAGRLIAERWQAGDQVVATSDKILAHYLPPHIRTDPVRGSANALSAAVDRANAARTWIVCPSPGPDAPTIFQRWLDRHCVRQGIIRQPRLDYFDYAVEVYLHPGNGAVAVNR